MKNQKTGPFQWFRTVLLCEHGIHWKWGEERDWSIESQFGGRLSWWPWFFYPGISLTTTFKADTMLFLPGLIGAVYDINMIYDYDWNLYDRNLLFPSQQ